MRRRDPEDDLRRVRAIVATGGAGAALRHVRRCFITVGTLRAPP